MARSMVTQWGMSEKMGPIRYGEREEMVFLGRQFSEHRNYSDRVAQTIDEEVRSLVEEAHQRCRELLTQYWDKMVLLADRLLVIETINAPEFEALMRGEQPVETTEKSFTPRLPTREPKTDEPVRPEKRTDSGLDLGGTLPAPA
jgi:cell division protease FtsH